MTSLLELVMSAKPPAYGPEGLKFAYTSVIPSQFQSKLPFGAADDDGVFVPMAEFADEQVGEAGVPGLHVHVPPDLHAPVALPFTLHAVPMFVGPGLVHVPHLPALQVCVPAPHTPQTWLVPFRHWHTDVLFGNPLLATASQLASFPESHVSYCGGT